MTADAKIAEHASRFLLSLARGDFDKELAERPDAARLGQGELRSFE
jgi:hypothetical protein